MNKKKKKKGKLAVIILAICIMVGIGGGYWYLQNQKADDTEETIVLTNGQTLVYAKIDAISGNEMTYTEVEGEEISMGDNSSNASSQNGKSGHGSASRMDLSSYEGVTTDDDGNMTGYVSTGTTNTLMIPVGTDVYTILGNTTTFSRLANGDLVKMILQTDDSGEEVIMKVWIIG